VVFEAKPASAGLTVHGSAIWSSASPMLYCNVLPGEKYFLDVSLAGYEDRRMKFSLGSDGKSLSLKGNRTPFVTRSIVVPGSGLYATGRHTRGLWTFTLNILALANVIDTYVEYDDARDLSTRLKRSALLAPTIPEQEQLLADAAVASARASALDNHFTRTLIFSGWLYASNIVETFLVVSPPTIRSVEESTVVIETPKKSNKRAALRSAFYPGMGQFYMGSDLKGTFFEAGFIAAGLVALDGWKEYDLATNARELALAELEAAQSPSEIAEALDNVALASDKRQDEETRRNVWLAITGSIWLLNIIDASFSDIPAHVDPIRLETSYANSTLWTGLRVSF